jgi:hypothetical protein
MSFYLGFVVSWSHDVHSCLLVVVFLFQRCFSELRAEETHLRGAGLLQVPCVLVARAPSTPVLPCSSAPPLLPTPSGGDSHPRTHTHCDYCGKDG